MVGTIDEVFRTIVPGALSLKLKFWIEPGSCTYRSGMKDTAELPFWSVALMNNVMLCVTEKYGGTQSRKVVFVVQLNTV